MNRRKKEKMNKIFWEKIEEQNGFRRGAIDGKIIHKSAKAKLKEQ